jgi:hypothetical protein
MEQTGAHSSRFVPGQSGNPLGAAGPKLRRTKLLADIAADFGGLDALSAGDRALLERAVSLLCANPKLHVERTRAINTAHRIINGIRRRVGGLVSV